jgi:cephalosporin hydroxylase
MSDWSEFYKAICDPSWPECEQIENFVKLPAHIQIEIVRDHLFDKKSEILANKIKHVDNDYPNSLMYIEEIKKIIGSDNCWMNNQDVVFLYSMLWSKRPNNVLEIGRWHGYSTAIIFGALEDSNRGHLYTIDIEDNTNPDIKSMVESRTTFVTETSENILNCPIISQQKYEVFFIDGDHGQNIVLADLHNSYKLSTDESWFLLHDADLIEVNTAIDIFLQQTMDVVDCGVYGEKIKLLYRKALS